MRRVFIGLGNPGARYQDTRHNLGCMVVRLMAQQHSLSFKREDRLTVDAVRANVDRTAMHLVLPTTFMNNSGRAVQRYLCYLRLAIADIVVVVDDVALPFGEVRLRLSGSAGGHNGLKNIEMHLGTQQYIRLRLGVGSPPPGYDLADYVLERFSAAEMAQLPQFLNKGAAALNCLLGHGAEVAMNLINSKDWQWSQPQYEQ
jgi:PTH1 family peptidyl-tRNA hydrolase